MKRATMLLAVLLSLAGLLVGSASAADAAPAATERLHSLDRAILLRLNAARIDRGLQPLTLSNDLDEAAAAHSEAMLEGGFFAHDSKNGASFVERLKRFYRASGFRSWSAGENLLYNTAPIDAETAIEAWLGSPAHRDNMLEPGWREVGIASLHTASAGGQFGGEPTWVITMDFGTRSGGDEVEKPAAKPDREKADKARLAKARAAKAKAAKKAARQARLEAAKAKHEKAKADRARQEKAEKPEKADKPKKPAKSEERPVDRVLPTPAGASGPEAAPDAEDEDVEDGDADVSGDEDPGDDEASPGDAEDDGPIEP